MSYTFSHKMFDLSLLSNALELSQDSEKRLVLFGAGGWGEALLSELEKNCRFPKFFTDNDPTKHGLSLKGKPVIPPASLDPRNDLVAITTVSAGDTVSIQLEAMGFKRNVNYFEVMENKDDGFPFHVVDFYSRHESDFHQKTILHVGPGGKLGVEILLCALGAQAVVSVEYNSYGIVWPDVTESAAYYSELAARIKQRHGADVFKQGILKKKNGRLMIDTQRIRLIYPCSVTCLPFDDNVFDCVFHHAVFEHVSEPEKGYCELFRVLKKGGKTVGLVDPQDHRRFSSFEQYHPLKFLELSRVEWLKIAERINYHNQLTTPEHMNHIKAAGFSVDSWNALERMDLNPAMIQTFHPMFRQFDPSELSVLRFEITATKRQAS